MCCLAFKTLRHNLQRRERKSVKHFPVHNSNICTIHKNSAFSKKTLMATADFSVTYIPRRTVQAMSG